MNANEDFSVSDLFGLLLRHLPIALVVATLVAAGVFYLQRNTEPVYEATATLIVSQPDTSGRNFGVSLVTAPMIDFAAYRQVLLSSPLISDTLRILGSPTALNDISLNVRTEVLRLSSMIYITAQGPEPEATANAANALVQAALMWDTGRASRSLDSIISTLEAQVDALNAQISITDPETDLGYNALATARAQRLMELNSARALNNAAVGLLEVVEPAVTPLQPVGARTVRNVAIAFILGLFLSYGLLLLRDSLDMRLKNSDDLAATTGLPVIGEFPKQTTGSYRLSREAASYLRTNILSATSGAHPKIILVTSAIDGEGKSSVALTLAASFAINGYHTLLIDADLRKPSIGRVLNLNPKLHQPLEKHLENPEATQGRFAPASVPLSNTQKIDVVPSFSSPSSPAELLSSGISACLEKWESHYDIIVIDSPPVLAVADALTIAPLCTGALIVTNLRRTDRKQVKAATDIMRRHHVTLLGAVANQVNEKEARYFDYGRSISYSTEKPKPVLTTKRIGAKKVE